MHSTYIFDLELTVNGNASSHFLTSFSSGFCFHLHGVSIAFSFFICLTCHFVVIAPDPPFPLAPLIYIYFFLPVHQGLSRAEQWREYIGVYGLPTRCYFFFLVAEKISESLGDQGNLQGIWLL